MFNFKASGISAAGAFFISMLLGLISGAGFGVVLLRAIIFAALFFILANAVWMIISRFMPDLLDGQSEIDFEADEHTRGAKVDISVGDDGEYATYSENASRESDVHQADGVDSEGENLEEVARRRSFKADEDESEFEEDVEEIETVQDLDEASDSVEIKTGLDHDSEAGYTVKKGESDEGTAAKKRRGTPARPPEIIHDVDELPDLQLFADSFVAPIVDEEQLDPDTSPTVSSASGFSSSSPKAAGSGNFDVNEMVSAIQTMLKRDQKG